MDFFSPQEWDDVVANDFIFETDDTKSMIVIMLPQGSGALIHDRIDLTGNFRAFRHARQDHYPTAAWECLHRKLRRARNQYTIAAGPVRPRQRARR